MDSQTKQAIEHAMNNNPAGMSEVIRDIIAGKVEVAIESRKQEIAQSLLQPQVEEYEIDEEIVKKLNLEAFSLDVLEDYIVSEEFEQLDELSKKTLANYVKKASADSGTNRSIGSGFTDKGFRKGQSDDSKKTYFRLGNQFHKKADKRLAGVGKAVDKLAK